MTKNGYYQLAPTVTVAGQCSGVDKTKLINKGLVCPYCDCFTQLVDSAEFYNGTSYGPVYACRPCRSWVGVHRGTTAALGRVADGELRNAKYMAHYYFDIIWRNKHMPRKQAYKWLAKQLRIPAKDCHIGWFDLKQCNKVIEVSRKFLNI